MAALRVGPLADAQLGDSGNASLTQHVGVEVRVSTSVFAGRKESNSFQTKATPSSLNISLDGTAYPA